MKDIFVYKSIDNEYYGSFYNEENTEVQVKLVNNKWYDYKGNYIRDWTIDDEKQAMENLPF